MSVVLDDMPPLMWHAELGKSLTGHVDRRPASRRAAARPARVRAGVGTEVRPTRLAASARVADHPRDGRRCPHDDRATGRDAVPVDGTARVAMGPRPGAGARPAPRGESGSDGSAELGDIEPAEATVRTHASRRPTARRSSLSPTRRWACSRPGVTSAGMTRAGSGAATSSPCCGGASLGGEIAVNLPL